MGYNPLAFESETHQTTNKWSVDEVKMVTTGKEGGVELEPWSSPLYLVCLKVPTLAAQAAIRGQSSGTWGPKLWDWPNIWNPKAEPVPVVALYSQTHVSNTRPAQSHSQLTFHQSVLKGEKELTELDLN